MTPTREQLELAAKAAGKKLAYEMYAPTWGFGKNGIKLHDGSWWHPVTSKTDSFDLMVACKMYVDTASNTIAFAAAGKTQVSAYLKDHNNDKELATMWAVFLCAVEIGRAM